MYKSSNIEDLKIKIQKAEIELAYYKTKLHIVTDPNNLNHVTSYITWLQSKVEQMIRERQILEEKATKH
jgi:hypothetical protein